MAPEERGEGSESSCQSSSNLKMSGAFVKSSERDEKGDEISGPLLALYITTSTTKDH